MLHQPGHDHRGQTAVELWIRQDRSLFGGVAAGHGGGLGKRAMGRAVAESRGETALLTPEEWRSGLGSFGAVLRTGLAPILDTRGVKGAADDVIANPWEILDATTANEHN